MYWHQQGLRTLVHPGSVDGHKCVTLQYGTKDLPVFGTSLYLNWDGQNVNLWWKVSFGLMGEARRIDRWHKGHYGPGPSTFPMTQVLGRRTPKSWCPDIIYPWKRYPPPCIKRHFLLRQYLYISWSLFVVFLFARTTLKFRPPFGGHAVRFPLFVVGHSRTAHGRSNPDSKRREREPTPQTSQRSRRPQRDSLVVPGKV